MRLLLFFAPLVTFLRLSLSGRNSGREWQDRNGRVGPNGSSRRPRGGDCRLRSRVRVESSLDEDSDQVARARVNHCSPDIRSRPPLGGSSSHLTRLYVTRSRR